MRGIRPGTLLSSRRWEVQFQDIVIEQNITIMRSVYAIVDTILLLYCTQNTIAEHTNRELGGDTGRVLQYINTTGSNQSGSSLD